MYTLQLDASEQNDNVLVVGTFEDSANSSTGIKNTSKALWFPLHFDADAPSGFTMTLSPQCNYMYDACDPDTQPERVNSPEIIIKVTGNDHWQHPHDFQ